jgi:Coenzyme PQQ synthesis protein D (PqqD)
MRYRVNAPHVIAETIGGETIIVHLSTGCYFSLGGSAPAIWEQLAVGIPVDEVRQQLSGRYDADDAELEAAVARIVDELQREELIVAEAGENGAPPAATSAPDAPAERAPFEQPTLSKFTDMQDIILLDPVHEVDARGWPHADPANAS